MLANEAVKIARICHELNRKICVLDGDFTQKTWGDAEQWQRDSAIKGVDFRVANPDAPESAQHDAWMADKISDGWVYGAVKDAVAKTHPCLVPFEQLPPMQRLKDAVFCAVVDTLK